MPTIDEPGCICGAAAVASASKAYAFASSVQSQCLSSISSAGRITPVAALWIRRVERPELGDLLARPAPRRRCRARARARRRRARSSSAVSLGRACRFAGSRSPLAPRRARRTGVRSPCRSRASRRSRRPRRRRTSRPFRDSPWGLSLRRVRGGQAGGWTGSFHLARGSGRRPAPSSGARPSPARRA